VRHSCYASPDRVSRWQGDLYASNKFADAALPQSASKIPYWMLANRSCQLIEDNGRTIKLSHLVFCAVVPLTTFVAGQEKSLKNCIANLVSGKDEFAAFLPDSQQFGLENPLIAHFNLVWAVPLEQTPKASEKMAQLSSPFAEHVFQRFTRWYYTVGYDDGVYRSAENIDRLVRLASTRRGAGTP
jgi:hypothetical protein